MYGLFCSFVIVGVGISDTLPICIETINISLRCLTLKNHSRWNFVQIKNSF
ncbi:hypothetical protein M758_5G052300 [Ceratodon purpureus]|nr:hypothetical protein M758_5G052300 [Ceratodon purpureus]